jgi:hypothetical protein
VCVRQTRASVVQSKDAGGAGTDVPPAFMMASRIAVVNPPLPQNEVNVFYRFGCTTFPATLGRQVEEVRSRRSCLHLARLSVVTRSFGRVMLYHVASPVIVDDRRARLLWTLLSRHCAPVARAPALTQSATTRSTTARAFAWSRPASRSTPLG